MSLRCPPKAFRQGRAGYFDSEEKGDEDGACSNRQKRRGEREPWCCANVFFQPANLSLAAPQKQGLDEKGAVITQTKLASS